MKTCARCILAVLAALPAAAPASAAVNHPVAISNFSFTPGSLVIAAGDSVTWTNTASLSLHSAVDDAATWTTGTIPAGGGKVTLVFAGAAAYNYHCGHHLFMTATLTVQGTVGVEDEPPVEARTWGRIKDIYKDR